MTLSQEREIDTALRAAGWAGATHHPLAGDASARRYVRLKQGGQSAILSISPPETSIAPFLHIADALRMHGFSAPKILHSAPSCGLILLEDLGDSLFPQVIAAQPELEPELYGATADLLAALTNVPPPDVPTFDTTAMVAALDPMFDHYTSDRVAREPIQAALRDALDRLPPRTPTLALRDVHAENLFWLPDRKGHSRIGLIDFQDAVLAHPAYDLASLLSDVRREVPAPIRTLSLARFSAGTGIGADELDLALATLSAQRNLRILGIFSRLASRGKPSYLALLPAVWARIQSAVAHPGLGALRDSLASLPPPEIAPPKRRDQ